MSMLKVDTLVMHCNQHLTQVDTMAMPAGTASSIY
ncbi:hypothetical protein Egran_03300 [Elaphomyces granulatus]|uniref:Uncharacterized protein n=1 Tax=Elaphomyces granulatus TaxID=519963 RepID=A0A232LY15_9EURO|nr:hypothetical protein Egran_03300 [Elaphomyces granulatus]